MDDTENKALAHEFFSTSKRWDNSFMWLSKAPHGDLGDTFFAAPISSSSGLIA